MSGELSGSRWGARPDRDGCRTAGVFAVSMEIAPNRH